MDNINADFKMETALNNFKNYKEEKERLINISKKMIEAYNEKIFEYQNQINNQEKLLKEQLFAMINQDKMKETKTEYNYKLPTAKIFIKKDIKSIQLKKNYDENEIPAEFIKVTRSVDWFNFKKNLKINGNNIINTLTGEIVESVEIKTSIGGELNFKIL